MVLAITYGDYSYRRAARLNAHMAKKNGADATRVYSKRDLDKEFKTSNKFILSQKRGGGYWIWKPYVILDALKNVSEGDYVVYSDAGTAFIGSIRLLIDCMNAEALDIMSFQLADNMLEKEWTKRDVFLRMDCDAPEFTDTPQRQGGISVFRKTDNSLRIVREWLTYSTDPGIVTDASNVLGKQNYPGFHENRHDQSVWSLVCKKEGIIPFRSPLQDENGYTNKDLIERSKYPVLVDWHHMGYMRWEWQLNSKWYRTRYRKFRSLKWVKDPIKKMLAFCGLRKTITGSKNT